MAATCAASGFPFHPISGNLSRQRPYGGADGEARLAGAGVTLYLGGARSGKSRLAQAAAEAIGGSPVYLATAQGWDDEMRDRIARHRDDRDARWRTRECPIDLAAAIEAEGGAGAVLLVDCLTLWLTNVMLAERDIAAATADLLAAIARSDATILIVSNEVGQGIVPDNALARRFRDAAGRLNQTIAAAADDVRFVVAGLEMRMK